MRCLDLTLPTPAENLALDEALLDEAEAAGRPLETLRLWESDVPMVVVGRSSPIQSEVSVEYCRAAGIPVLRRSSGGAAVVIGPGCLMYALVLSFQRNPALRAIHHAHELVLETIAAALRPAIPEVVHRGTCDLAVDLAGLFHGLQPSFPPPLPETCERRIARAVKKFSGNSVRAKRDHLLYHGTILYQFPLDLISRCLKTPLRQPDYRQDRSHEDFVANLPMARDAIRQALVRAWQATEPCRDWPRELTAELVRRRYGLAEWNEG